MNPREVVMSLPDVARLVWRVVRDDRVAIFIRTGLVAVGAYLLLPWDIVPDWVPLAGQLDDVVVLTLGLRTFLRMVPKHILLEHWPSEPGKLERLLGRDLT